MNANELTQFLNEMSVDTNWVSNLEERKIKELEFHDQQRDMLARLGRDTFEKFYTNQKYYTTTALSRNYINTWIKSNVKDKVFLEYACGNGEIAIRAAKNGAKLAIGIDISSVSINNAKNEAIKQKVVDNTFFTQADAENTKLPSNSIDIIICCGVLHHLDLSYALPELRRILAPGGKILAIEALNYNPFIKLYRKLTPDMRTEWEKAHILSLKDVEFAKRFFHIQNIKFWHVTSYLAAHFKFLLPALNIIDSMLTRIPILQLFAWTFTFEMYKNS